MMLNTDEATPYYILTTTALLLLVC